MNPTLLNFGKNVVRKRLCKQSDLTPILLIFKLIGRLSNFAANIIEPCMAVGIIAYVGAFKSVLVKRPPIIPRADNFSERYLHDAFILGVHFFFSN